MVKTQMTSSQTAAAETVLISSDRLEDEPLQTVSMEDEEGSDVTLRRL